MDVQIWLAVGLAMVIGLMLIFSGRLRERYGSLQPSSAATRSYERHQLDQGLVYYTSGSDVYPQALIGIDRRFNLVSDHWKRRDFNTETFCETVQNMQAGALSSMRSLHGFEILDQKGRPVGTWYSLLDARTTIKMLSGNRIRVDTPPSAGSATI